MNALQHWKVFQHSFELYQLAVGIGEALVLTVPGHAVLYVWNTFIFTEEEKYMFSVGLDKFSEDLWSRTYEEPRKVLVELARRSGLK